MTVQSDLRLVTMNAKMFNPPGSIYYTEAERIEAWALDHIQKASATVIQYETDWNIDVEKDDESCTQQLGDGDGASSGLSEEHIGWRFVCSRPGIGGMQPHCSR